MISSQARVSWSVGLIPSLITLQFYAAIIDGPEVVVFSPSDIAYRFNLLVFRVLQSAGLRDFPDLWIHTSEKPLLVIFIAVICMGLDYLLDFRFQNNGRICCANDWRKYNATVSYDTQFCGVVSVEYHFGIRQCSCSRKASSFVQ